MLCHDAPWAEPVEIAARLRAAPGFVFLDSGGEDLHAGRHAFIGIDPFGEFAVEEGRAVLNGETLDGPPLERLREVLSRFRLDPDPEGPPLRGGAVGHVAYEFGGRLERLPVPARRAPDCAELRVGLYDLIFAFDRAERRLRIFSSGFPAPGGAARRARAKARLAEALARLDAPAAPAAPNPPVTDWRSPFTDDGFAAAVEQVREHIRSGDIFQANLTRRLEAALPEGFEPWSFYTRLRAANPAPFAAYLRDGETVFACSSPERFLSLRGGMVEARPIKGTAPRDPDPARDRANAKALLASEKDRAENVMIVDLMRNDLSRVCAPGSVEVPALCRLESYASVHHLTSVVRGRLAPGRDALDLLAACFPGGSITGAPKIRAMEIITALEGLARGVYCGAIGYIGFDGDMDLNIPIRTAILGGGRAVVQAGGGITLLSDPEAETAEARCKAERLLTAFAGGEA